MDANAEGKHKEPDVTESRSVRWVFVIGVGDGVVRSNNPESSDRGVSQSNLSKQDEM